MYHFDSKGPRWARFQGKSCSAFKYIFYIQIKVSASTSPYKSQRDFAAVQLDWEQSQCNFEVKSYLNRDTFCNDSWTYNYQCLITEVARFERMCGCKIPKLQWSVVIPDCKFQFSSIQKCNIPQARCLAANSECETLEESHCVCIFECKCLKNLWLISVSYGKIATAQHFCISKRFSRRSMKYRTFYGPCEHSWIARPPKCCFLRCIMHATSVET